MEVSVPALFPPTLLGRQDDTQGPSNSSEGRDWDAWRRLPEVRRSGIWRKAGVFDRQNDRRYTDRSTYGNRPLRNHVNQGFENRNRIDRNDRGFENRGGWNQFRNKGWSDNFNRGSINNWTTAVELQVLSRLEEEEEMWDASDHPQDVIPQNWGETELNHSVTCMVLKATANDKHHLALCHDEFHGP
ncbi:uncharacterized protein TNCV_3766521 [Trichonephila clavipes]|nr:uncharacterized protein TNCV_3766521 [Trichonephila clavipes]